jgi:CO/xanthine dehydrogenase Mo-binding subunit
MTPTFTRGSGEALGVFTLECMMDEPASQLGIDPIEPRLRNLTEVDPNTGNPWSSHGLRNVTSGVHSDSAGPGATRGRDLSATGSG